MQGLISANADQYHLHCGLKLKRQFVSKVSEESQPLLTITTHLGLFQYCRLPFGVATAPAMWQRAMSIVLQGCERVVYFIDDILVTGKTRKEHEANLRKVFQLLQQFGLRINLGNVVSFRNRYNTWATVSPWIAYGPQKKE